MGKNQKFYYKTKHRKHQAAWKTGGIKNEDKRGREKSTHFIPVFRNQLFLSSVSKPIVSSIALWHSSNSATLARGEKCIFRVDDSEKSLPLAAYVFAGW